MIDIGQDYITISDKHGEIVHWIEDEWIEDPSIVASIANAIHVYHIDGPSHLRVLVDNEEV